jgi:hypothetical protein
MNEPLDPAGSAKTVLLDPDNGGRTAARRRATVGPGKQARGRSPGLQTPRSGLELVGEVAHLAVGTGILTFALAPLALPFLALTALVAVVLVIPALGVALLLAPLLVLRRCWRSGDRSPGATKPARPIAGGAGYETKRYGLVGVRGGPGA